MRVILESFSFFNFFLENNHFLRNISKYELDFITVFKTDNITILVVSLMVCPDVTLAMALI